MILITAALAALGSSAPSAEGPVATAPAGPGGSVAPVAEETRSGFRPLAPLDPLFSVLDLDFHLGPWKFRGYVQFDGARYDQAPAGPPEEDFRRGGVGDPDTLDARDLKDGSYLRRARFGGEGRLGARIAYRAMFEFGANGKRGDPKITEVWVSYNRFAPYVIAAGAFPQLANMEDATGTDSNLFLERATAAALSRNLGAGDGRLGVQVRRADKKWLVAVSLTGPVIDHASDYSPRAAIVARATRTLEHSSDRSIHLGASATYVLTPAVGRKPDDPLGVPIRLLSQPEVRVDPTTLIDTGDISADHASVLGVEFAAQNKNLYLQAEAFRFQVDRQAPTELSNPHFFGFYVEGSWILTGERRRWDASRGAFWFPTPDRPLGAGGWGAFEIAFRYSRMNLNYHPGSAGLPPPPEGVRGGDQKLLAAALEWYPRRRVRVMFEYMHVTVDRLNPAGPADPEPFGPSPSTPPIGAQVGQSLDIAAARVRYAF